MGKRSHNPHRVKIHFNYTVEEVASLFDVHKTTVREWIKAGLPSLDDKRPKLILGPDLFAFLQVKRTKNKRPCQPGEMYCVKCRTAKIPAENMMEYQPRTETQGNLFGICPDCGTGMNQFANLAKLEQMKGQMAITVAGEVQRLIDRGQPPVNSDFR